MPLEDPAVLLVHVIPGSSKNLVVRVEADGTVRIKVAAPAVEGKANIGLVKFLSECLDLPISRIKIVRGEKARKKTVRLVGISLSNAKAKLNNLSNQE
ncbi:MAG: hypothetical protein C0391_04880 [Anaerolinea sp.]|nr:hypothetical protein [Anaerolinea sp.]